MYRGVNKKWQMFSGNSLNQIWKEAGALFYQHKKIHKCSRLTLQLKTCLRSRDLRRNKHKHNRCTRLYQHRTAWSTCSTLHQCVRINSLGPILQGTNMSLPLFWPKFTDCYSGLWSHYSPWTMTPCSPCLCQEITSCLVDHHAHVTFSLFG